jgi:DNA adenine methylase
MNAPARPVVRWFGGKWKLAPWIIAHFPAHRVYVEPFGGGGSVLIRKPRSYAEVYNDLDGEVVNLFRVLRDDAMSAKLIEQLRLTPFARAELQDAYELTDEPIERARRLVTLSFLGFGANAHARVATGFRANGNRAGTTPSHDWRNYPDALTLTIERLRGVVIENRDACEVMAMSDVADALHYVDPPYVWATRGRHDRQRGYTHEMNDDDHVRLLAFLKTLKGMVVLSGYPTQLYDDALADWQRVERQAFADGARERTEVLWINPACAEKLRSKGPLFEAINSPIASLHEGEA